MAWISSRVRELIGLTPPKRRYWPATCSRRAGGMLRPAVTRSRNGSTSSMPSGPPKETTRRASTGSVSASVRLGLHVLASAVPAHVALGAVAQHGDHLLLHHRRAAFG